MEIRSERGGEFWSNDFKEFCDNHGIKRDYTIQRTPWLRMIRQQVEG